MMSTTEPLPPLETIPARRWVRLGVAYLVLGAGAWWYAPRADPFSWFVHGAWCFLGLAVALPTLLAVFRRGFTVVLTDHRLIFLAAFSLYFLFGAALPAVGPVRQAESSLSLYPTDPSSALRADAVNALGFGVALLTSGLSRGRWLGNQAGRVAGFVGRVPYNRVVGLFLLIGAAATSYRIPFDLGFRQGVVSGAVRALAQLSLVAIFMASSSRGANERVLRWFGVALTVVLVVVGAAQFMKSEALLPLLALMGGLAFRFGTRRVLPIGLALIVAAFWFLGDLVNYGRSATGTSNSPSSLSQRWSYLQEGWAISRSLGEAPEYGYWGRLCYVPAQVAALEFRDEGRGGNGLQLMWWVFVPRFLAPNKPQMTGMFAEFNEKITGSDLSSNSPGIFGSGYYHGGWWGLWLASVLCGWILAQTSAIARAVYVHRAALLMPFSLLGMFIAFRIDGDFIPDYLGVFMFILYPLLAAAMLVPAARSGGTAQSELPQRTPC